MFRSFPKVSLRLLLTIPFVLQVVSIVGIVTYFSYKTCERSMAGIADRLAVDLNSIISSHLNHYLSEVQEVNSLNARGIKAGAIDIHSSTNLKKYFAEEVKQFNFNFVYLSKADGSLVGAGDGEQSLKMIERLPVDQAHLHQDLIKAKASHWSPIDIWAELPNNSHISAHQVVHDSQGKFLGVLGVNFKLDTINQFLEQLSEEHSAIIFIVDRSGLLVANSEQTPLASIVNGQATRLAAIASPNLKIRTISQFVIDHSGKFETIDNSPLLSFNPSPQSPKNSYFLKITPYKDSYGLDWLIVTAIPAAPLMNVVNFNIKNNIILCSSALLISIALSIWTSRRITHSLILLNRGIQALKENDFNTILPATTIAEVDQLSDNFRHMTMVLQEAKRLQDHYQETLEAEVALQTAALKQAQSIVHTGSWSFEIKTGVVTWSEELYQIYETDQYPLEFPHLKISRIYEGDRDKYQREIVDAINVGISFNVDLRIITQKGNLRYVQSQGCPVFDSSGELLRYVGTITDISDRKKIEQSLETREAYLKLAMEIADVIAWERNLEIDQLTFTSSAHLQYPPLSFAEALNVCHPDDRDRIIQAHEKAITEVGHFQIEHRVLATPPSTGWRWIRASGRVLTDSKGNPSRIVGMSIDMTESKEIEAKLRASETALIEAQRIAHIGSWSFDLASQKITWSEELFRMFGLDSSQPEPTYEEYLNLLDPKDRPLLIEGVKNAIANGIPYLVDYKALLANGRIRFHEGRGEAEYNEQGEVVRLFGTGLDITDRKLIEIELKDRTEELDRFFSVALDLLCIANAEGYFIRLNPEWEKVLGIPIEQLIGTQFLDYVHPEDLASTLESMEILETTGKLPNFVNRYRCMDGTYRWIEWRSVRIGTLSYAAARDITERKQFEEELQEAKDRAEASTRAKSDFLASMSHEIRTPISSVISIAHLLHTPNLSAIELKRNLKAGRSRYKTLLTKKAPGCPIGL